MRHTVIVEKPAEYPLARIWMRATDQQAVANAFNRIEGELKDDAHAKGVPLGIFRRYADTPVEVLDYVDPGDCKVRIFQVRRTN